MTATPTLFQFLKLSLISLLLAACTQAIGFTDRFADSGTLVEAESMAKSADPHWWLNSGGYIRRSGGGLAMTNQGRLATTDWWRLRYAASNPRDTDDGYRPQNLIRLVTREKFKNFTQQALFFIDQINQSDSPNRNESNGILFFHRYQDGKNLYYAGIRVDGAAVIKKKIHGQYTTLKSVAIYPGTYNRETKPNLLPLKRWIGLRTVIADTPNGNVEIAVYLKDDAMGSDWKKVIEAEDTGAAGDRVLAEGYAGIRTDFMDVRFDDYEATEIRN